MTHPLTDDIIEEIKSDVFSQAPKILTPGIAPSVWSSDCMRAAYDLAVEQITEQWEEVIDSNKTDIQVIREFDKRLKAMRPQVVDLPQANSDVCGEEGMERARQRTFEENDELMRKLADS